MSFKFLFVLNALVNIVFGMLLVIVPKTGLEQFSMSARVPELFYTQVAGAALASLGFLLWFAKNADDALQKQMGMAALAGTVLGLVVTLIGVFKDLIPVNSWIVIVVEVVFVLGYAFMLFLKPKMKE